MIRIYQQSDQEQVMSIWLNTNLQAHSFISANYWRQNFEAVRDYYLSASHTFVDEKDGVIRGFASVMENGYIGAVFVAKDFQKQGIGGNLIYFLQKLFPVLNLKVYAKNLRAVGFYRRHGFKILMSEIDKDTGEEELTMYWSLGYLTINDASSHSSR